MKLTVLFRKEMKELAATLRREMSDHAAVVSNADGGQQEAQANQAAPAAEEGGDAGAGGRLVKLTLQLRREMRELGDALRREMSELAAGMGQDDEDPRRKAEEELRRKQRRSATPREKEPAAGLLAWKEEAQRLQAQVDELRRDLQKHAASLRQAQANALHASHARSGGEAPAPGLEASRQALDSLGTRAEMLATIEDLRMDMAALEHRLSTAASAGAPGGLHLGGLADRVASLEGMAPGQAGKQFEARLMALERQVANAASPTMWRKQGDALRQVHGELSRLRERVDGLEKTDQSGATAGGEGGAQDQHNHAEEVQNLYKVIRALQRDAGLHCGKVEDLTEAVASVKASVEAALPHVLSFMVDVRNSQGGGPEGLGGKFEGTRIEQLFEQLRALGIPLRYATCESQEALKTDISDVEKRLRDEVGQLGNTIGQLLRRKADSDEVNALIGKLVLESKGRNANGMEDLIEESAALRVPLGARCLACDRKLDVVASRPSPWDRGGSPAAQWPLREPGCPIHHGAGPPAGYRQRREREWTLPAIEQEGFSGGGGHSRPPPHS